MNVCRQSSSALIFLLFPSQYAFLSEVYHSPHTQPPPPMFYHSPRFTFFGLGAFWYRYGAVGFLGLLSVEMPSGRRISGQIFVDVNWPDAPPRPRVHLPLPDEMRIFFRKIISTCAGEAASYSNFSFTTL